jgi:hypothetical protein
MKKQNVNIVTLNVKNVPKIHIQTVPNVLNPEKINYLTAHVMMENMKPPISFVKIVLTNVKNVQEVPIIVLHVLLAE